MVACECPAKLVARIVCVQVVEECTVFSYARPVTRTLTAAHAIGQCNELAMTRWRASADRHVRGVPDGAHVKQCGL